MKKHIHLIAASALMLMSVAGANAQRITVTVAGNGTNSYSGDSGPAKQAALSRPNDVCLDGAHNIYFSDQSQTVIRKLTSATGVITTIAGGGSSTGDGIPGISASITPGSICADLAGNVYITSGDLLRRIDAATGIITTVAGAGSSTADGVPAASASLTGLNSVCADNAGNLYVVAGNRIRKINTSTGMITTLAGTGAPGYTGDGGSAITATLSAPKYIAADLAGNIYFGDQSSGISFGDVIRRVDAGTGIITSVIGGTGSGILFGCAGLTCMVGGLSGLCCDHDGNVIFNEWSCSCRKWDRSTDWVSPIGGSFYSESFSNDTASDFAYMNNNYGVCSDEANNYYIADRENHRIRKIMSLTSTPTFAFGAAQSVKACAAGAISLDPLLWITDQDAAQTETWTVVSAPVLGTLSGFPATASSHGLTQTTKPTGLYYVSSSASASTDSFMVRISDGTASNIIKIRVQVGAAVDIVGLDNVCIGSSISLVPTIMGGTWGITTPHASVSASGVVTGISAGTDNVLYTVDNGCGTVTVEQMVTVSVSPDAGTIAGEAGVCEEATISLTDVATGGAWSVAGTNVSVAPSGAVLGVHAGTAVVSYSVTNACGTAAATKVINVFALPNPGVIAGVDDICLKGSTPFTTSSIEVGYWSAANDNATVSTSGVIYGKHVGTDIISYNVTNECGTRQATKTVNITNCAATDIQEIASQSSISVYPNPASYTLTVNGGVLPAGAATIRLSDATGRIVMSDELTNAANTRNLDVTKLSSGVYLLTITGAGLNFADKVTINR